MINMKVDRARPLSERVERYDLVRWLGELNGGLVCSKELQEMFDTDCKQSVTACNETAKDMYFSLL